MRKQNMPVSPTPDSAEPTPTYTRVFTGIAIVLAVFAFTLGIISAGDNVLGWDLTFGTWIQHWEGSFGEAMYSVGDVLGTTSLAATVTVIALLVAMVKKQVQISAFLVLVLLLRLLGTQLKPLFDSPRPTAEQLRQLETFEGTGYPSGHSMTVAMVALMLVFVAWRYLDDKRACWAVTAISVIAVLLVGWSRVWSGAHWPSDVLGGWSFGFFLVMIAWKASDAVAALPVFMRGTTVNNPIS